MLSPARFFAISLRWLALACGIIAASAGFLLQPGQQIAATTPAFGFATTILLWMAAGFIDRWSTRHARRRLQALLATIDVQEIPAGKSLGGQDKRCTGGKLPATQLATSPASRPVEYVTTYPSRGTT